MITDLTSALKIYEHADDYFMAPWIAFAKEKSDTISEENKDLIIKFL